MIPLRPWSTSSFVDLREQFTIEACKHWDVGLSGIHGHRDDLEAEVLSLKVIASASLDMAL